MDLQNNSSSFGSIPDRLQKGPVLTEGQSGPIFQPDPFVIATVPVQKQPINSRDRFQTDLVRKLDRIALLFTRDLSGTGPERIQNWTCCFAGPVLDPLRTGSRKVPCKHLDRFETVPCKQKPIRFGSGPVPCKHSLHV